MMSNIHGALRGGHGVLYERQPLVGALDIYAGGLGGRPAGYAPVRLDGMVVGMAIQKISTLPCLCREHT